MVVAISWQQALAWRMHRHFLDPVGRARVADVVGRLCGVQAQVASSAELAIRVRRETSRAGEVDRALRQGRLIKTWAMRGTLHLLKPEEAGAFLSLIAAGRSWERPSWQRYFGVTTKQLDALRHAARVALESRPLTRDELVTAIIAQRGLGHVGEALRSGWGTLLKPLAWQGDLCYGPSQGTRVTFMRPEDASSRWRGLPDPDQAAPDAIVAYFRTYGPTTIDAFGNWLAGADCCRASTSTCWVLAPGMATSCRRRDVPRSAGRAAGSRQSWWSVALCAAPGSSMATKCAWPGSRKPEDHRGTLCGRSSLGSRRSLIVASVR